MTTIMTRFSASLVCLLAVAAVRADDPPALVLPAPAVDPLPLLDAQPAQQLPPVVSLPDQMPTTVPYSDPLPAAVPQYSHPVPAIPGAAPCGCQSPAVYSAGAIGVPAGPDYGYGVYGDPFPYGYTGAFAAGMHVRHPYYSYRRPWYANGPASLNVTIAW
jgi:hypothetical protein